MLASRKVIVQTPGGNAFVVLLPANPRRVAVTIYSISSPANVMLCFGPDIDSFGHIDGIQMIFPAVAQQRPFYTFRYADIGPIIQQDVRINDGGGGQATIGAYETFEID